MNKRIGAFLLICMLGIGSLFATSIAVGPTSGGIYPVVGYAYQPVSARSLGMGNAGLAVSRRIDSFYLNPATLADKEFRLSVPSVGVKVYNLHNMLSQGVIEDLIEGGGSSSSLINAATNCLNIISSQGFNQVDVIDASVSFTAWGFGLAVQAQQQLFSYSPLGQVDTTQILMQLDGVITLGYGYRFKVVEDKFSIDVGLSMHFNYRAYNSQVNGQEVMPLIINAANGEQNVFDSLLKSTPMMAGYAFPFDIGINFNIPCDFTFSLVAKNLNGQFYMTAYPGVSNWSKSLFGTTMTADGSINPGSNESFKFMSKWSLDFGIGWEPQFGKVGNFIRPTVAIDFVDIVGFFQNGPSWSNLLLHLNMGAEIQLLSFLDIRAGLDQGYVALGVGLDLFVIRIDASYNWQEFGQQLGDKPVDSLTIRVNIGYDR